VSVFIDPVAPVDISTATALPTSGTITNAVSGETFAITDPSTATNPAIIQIDGAGTVNVVPATQGANVIVQGSGTATIEVGLPQDSAGNLLSNSGSLLQVDPTYAGSVIVNYEGAIVDGTKVNTGLEVVGGGTVASNAPGVAAAFEGAPNAFTADNVPDFYIQTGSADDQIQGTAGNDFIRGGAGSDLINAGAGNDTVRGGAGSDTVTLGPGNDVYYLTVDQLQGTSTDTITDFTSGEDQVLIAANIEGRVSISGFGTKALVISLSGSETGTTELVSGVNGTAFQEDDVAFV